MSPDGPAQAPPSPVTVAFEAAYGHVLGHRAVSVASIGLRAGLFAAVQERGPVGVPELATGLGLDEHLLRVWCRAAFAAGFLDVDDDGRHSLAPGAAPAGSPSPWPSASRLSTSSVWSRTR